MREASANGLYRNQRRMARLDMLQHYGGSPPKCACCGEAGLPFLTMDHINNDGAAHGRRLGFRRNGISTMALWYDLRRRGWPLDMQVLCYNCNCAKEHSGHGICPHKLI